MVPKPKKSPKIGELCLKLVKFVVFTQKIQKKIAFGSSEKFHMELAKDNLHFPLKIRYIPACLLWQCEI